MIYVIVGNACMRVCVCMYARCLSLKYLAQHKLTSNETKQRKVKRDRVFDLEARIEDKKKNKIVIYTMRSKNQAH